MPYDNAVAVVAESDHDWQMMSRLLTGRDFRLFNRSRSLLKFLPEFKSIIVCHRSSQRFASPSLPVRLSGCRVIVISDCADERTIVMTLDGGAHYYFHFNDTEYVLKTRIDAALRDHSLTNERTLSIGPYSFNINSRTAFYQKRKIDLTNREFELAHYLFLHRDRVVSESELLNNVWTIPHLIHTRRVATAASNIRTKLNLNDDSKWQLVRLRGTGFKVCSV